MTVKELKGIYEDMLKSLERMMEETDKLLEEMETEE